MARRISVEQRRHPLGLGDEVRFAHVVAHERRVRGHHDQAREVAEVHHPHDVVDALAEHGQARAPAVDREVEGLADRRGRVDADDVDARDHHLAHDGVAELDDRVNEVALVGLDGASSWATSAIASTSDSVTRGFPSLPPKSEITRSATASSTTEIHRIGQNRRIRPTTGARVSAASSGCWMAKFFGMASKTTKMTMTSPAVATNTPGGAEQVSGQNTHHRRRDQLADEHQRAAG